MELVVFVGIPASGKSTESVKYREVGYVVLSSDEIRSEFMNGKSLADFMPHEQDVINAKVFAEVYGRAEAALAAGKSVVVDATHVKSKYRRDVLLRYGKFSCPKKCLVFLTPFEICLERNRRRVGQAFMPEDAMLWMLGNFECPDYSEGWDEIIPVTCSETYKLPFTETRNFTYGTAEYNNCKAYLYMVEHLCGKEFTKAEADAVFEEASRIAGLHNLTETQ